MMIKKKIALTMLAFSIIPMLFVGVCGYIYAKNTIETVRLEDFNKIADLKARMVEKFFTKLKDDIHIIANNAYIQKKTELLTNLTADVSVQKYEKLKNEIDTIFEVKHVFGHLLRVLIFNPQGVIIYEYHGSYYPSGGLGEGLPTSWRTTVEKGKKGVSFSNIDERISKGSIGSIFSMLITAPVHNEADNIAGVIAFEISVGPIYDEIQEATGFGNTGEVLIARNEGETALFLNPLRHDPEAALKRRVNLGEERAMPIQKALRGEIGSGRSVDYRGKDVIAAWRYIPSLGWGMVAKIDVSEEFEPIYVLLKIILTLVTITMLAGLFAASYISKIISDPILSLLNGVKIIGRGNFDYKIGSVAKNEMGQLGMAIDQMTDNLKAITASRDDLNKEINHRKQMEKMLKRSNDETKNRVKELNCLFEMSDLIEQQDISLEGFFQKVVALIPKAWQYPEITCARIILNGDAFSTNSFRKTPWILSSDIIVHKEKVGDLTVCYLEEKHDRNCSPFLEEEKRLIEAISERVGRTVERIRVEKALIKNEKRFRLLVEDSLTGISIVQKNQAVYQNKEMERLLGPLPRKGLFGNLDRIHPDDHEKIIEEIQSFGNENNDRMDLEFRLVTPGETSKKTVKWIYCRSIFMEYRDKKSIWMNMMDMSKTKELEHLLFIQDKMASLGRVAAGIAHEIRNPLSGINIYLRTMEKIYNNGDNFEKIPKIIRQINSASMKIESVIKRVMDFSKQGTPRLVKVDINKSIREALSLTSVALRKRDITLCISLAESLPLCYAEPNQFEEVILNLMNNAAEAMQKMEKKQKEIAVTSKMANNRILVSISDSGPGIPHEIREKVFEPFYTTKPEGTGIGLNICNRIIQDHGGAIGVYSNEWGGTEFVIEIPIAEKGQ